MFARLCNLYCEVLLLLLFMLLVLLFKVIVPVVAAVVVSLVLLSVCVVRFCKQFAGCCKLVQGIHVSK